MKKLSATLLILCSLSLTGFILQTGINGRLDTENNIISSLCKNVERQTTQTLSSLPIVPDVARELTYFSGNIRRNGVFITDSHLLPDNQNNHPERTTSNIEALQNRLNIISSPCYFTLVPTATAIKQQELPTQLDSLFNERSFIQEVYQKMSDSASTIDVYSGLFSAKDQYTYYRNDPGLTALGGYYLYEDIIARLGYTPLSINQFQVEHLKTDFYGKWAETTDYYGLPADVISFYSPYTEETFYSVTHRNSNSDLRRYYTLFPTHLSALDTGTNITLGGLSHVIDILSTVQYQETCLVVGDYTAQSYLPFMANHYGQLTFLSVTAPEDITATIDYNAYDRVIFVLSVDTLLNYQLY